MKMSWAEIRSYRIESGCLDCKMIHTSKHIARKQLHCDCGDVIAIGERYYAEVFRLDGELQHSKMGLDHVHSWDREVMAQAVEQGLIGEEEL